MSYQPIFRKIYYEWIHGSLVVIPVESGYSLLNYEDAILRKITDYEELVVIQTILQVFKILYFLQQIRDRANFFKILLPKMSYKRSSKPRVSLIPCQKSLRRALYGMLYRFRYQFTISRNENDCENENDLKKLKWEPIWDRIYEPICFNIATNVRNYTLIIILSGDGKLIPEPIWEPIYVVHYFRLVKLASGDPIFCKNSKINFITGNGCNKYV